LEQTKKEPEDSIAQNSAEIPDETRSKLRALFGDLDLVTQDTVVNETLEQMHSVGIFKEILKGERGLLNDATRTTV